MEQHGDHQSENICASSSTADAQENLTYVSTLSDDELAAGGLKKVRDTLKNPDIQ